MYVVKVQASSVSYVAGASGRIPAKYAAVTDDGVEVVYFTPSGQSGGYQRASSSLKDLSGKALVLSSEFARPVSTLAQFREWVADELSGAVVRVCNGPL